MLDANFEGHERVRQMLLNKTPRYGNDDDYADSVMVDLFDVYFNAIDGRPNTKGGAYHINLLPTTVHVYFGSVIGATPDGRRAGLPLSEGISPVQGADRHGPTAVIKSVAKMDHARTGGTLLNQKFTPQLLKDDEGLDKLVQLIRTYFKLDGHHIQFNVVDAATLRAAQKNPEQLPGPDRARGGLQRLFLRPRPGAAGRDHRPDGTSVFLIGTLRRLPTLPFGYSFLTITLPYTTIPITPQWSPD